ncbi:carboxypeptidase-like regulatory domain-containing protein [Tenacibaculum jejuense]|uniref:TonB dependent/ligand-gated channel n=1 Tax=Tenacibaculum jejuense TaxID=584609 RepID=A0A238UE52_9FLAO|nr:carboxypeptidase-like regulatory domain-containing protein [Tenacibaculum jejuense]SNR17483.1 TonB dependent/ligand-gated channel [Tenacibaculum jejuense]
MKQIILTVLFCFTISYGALAQNTVKGVVKDSDSEKVLQGVSVSIEGRDESQVTNIDGTFALQNLPDGKFIVTLKKVGYETQNYPVTLSGSVINLGDIFMYVDEFSDNQDLSTIIIADDELNDDSSAADNISSLLQSSRDVYLRAAAFEFSAAFFRIRGLDSDNAKLLINGIEMNKLETGRPEWANWGGLNDVLRNQEFTNGLAPSNYTFGGILGSTHISTRASQYRKGARISYASSNRSYRHRVMGTYSSGLLKDGWAFSVSGTRRAGSEGFVDGTSYDATSLFASVEKVFNDSHSLNLTSIFASNKRGVGSPNTQEVTDLRGIRYNSNWGFQNGEIRNSRIKDVEEPFTMLSHYWKINDRVNLNTNVSYQFGKIGRSRIDFNGGQNPNPTDFRNLPSFWIDEGDLAEAFEAEQRFLNDGQIDWEEIYSANINNSQQGIDAAYVLNEDRVDDDIFNVNTILNADLTDNITLNGKLQYTKLESERFANVLDLLGSTTGYLDINRFGSIGDPERQSDLLNPNRIVQEGDRFKYNYIINSEVMNGFLQAQFKYNKVDFYIAGDITRTSHQREGLYQSGRFENNSFGKSEKQEFTTFGVKGGITYKLSGRHILDFNAGYLEKAPTIRNTFTQIRESNLITEGLDTEKILSFDASYIIRSPRFTSRVTGYFSQITDDIDSNFFFFQSDLFDSFVQETVTGADKRHMGVELGFEYKLTSTLNLKGAANIGEYYYSNNPDNVQFSAEDTETARAQGFVNGVQSFGTTYLKNYRLNSGPQKAYSLGIEYRDPDYWWVSLTGNYFDDTYIGVSPVLRSSAFFTDNDGLPINNYDPIEAKRLLEQEEFGGYFIANAIGGKSWKVSKDNKYIGFTLGISNIFNQQFRTGGFEQARTGGFNQLSEDFNRSKRLFGPRYWFGRGTNYFFNVYYRF